MTTTSRPQNSDFDVLIVGAGISGIGANRPGVPHIGRGARLESYHGGGGGAPNGGGGGPNGGGGGWAGGGGPSSGTVIGGNPGISTTVVPTVGGPLGSSRGRGGGRGGAGGMPLLTLIVMIEPGKV